MKFALAPLFRAFLPLRIGLLILAASHPVPATGEDSGDDLPALKGISFLRIEDKTVPWTAWGEDEAAGFSFLFDRIGEASATPERLIVLFPGDPSTPCFLEPTLRTAAADRPTLLIQVLLQADNRFLAGEEEPLIEVCRGLRQEYGFPPEEVVLVGEGARSATVLTLSSNHRMEFGGLLVWEGEPGAALPLNLVETPIALLGDRKKLNAHHLFLEECRELGVPIKMNTYWGGVEDFELADDLREILGWMSAPERKPLGRRIAHSTYLARHGRHGWIWITQPLTPGLPASLTVDWRASGIVEARPSGVRRFRLRLDSTFDRYGRRIEFAVGKLRLPITLKREVEAIEFEYSEGRDSWAARFLRFDEPVEENSVIPARQVDYSGGDSIPGFAAYVRGRTQVDCAWGDRFPEDIPHRAFGAEDLYRLVPPIPYVDWEAGLDRIDAFDAWLKREVDPSAESSWAPGVRANAREGEGRLIRAIVPFPQLLAFHQDLGEPLPGGLKARDNFQHLLGLYLGRDVAASLDSVDHSQVGSAESPPP